MWKYLSSYESLDDATTRSQSRRVLRFRYFFVRYLRYLLEKGTSEERTTRVLTISTLTPLTASWPVLPPTLILWLRKLSKSSMLMILSSTGLLHSMLNFTDCFFFLRVLPPFTWGLFAAAMLIPC
ncbi:hypothetical protein PENTCL1PPCAC_3053, partial [Pristionchus entomophagus]